MSYIFLLYFLVPSFFSPSNPLPFQSFRRRLSLIGTASAASASIQPAGLPPPFPPAAEEKKKEREQHLLLPSLHCSPSSHPKKGAREKWACPPTSHFISLPPSFPLLLRPDPVIKPERSRARNQGDLTGNQGKGEGKGQKIFSNKSFFSFFLLLLYEEVFLVGLVCTCPFRSPDFPTCAFSFPSSSSYFPPPSSSYVNARVRNDCSSLPLFPLLHPPFLFLRPKGK